MSEQLSFLSDLDRASDTRKPNLCRSWKNAIMNEHGVFIDNRIDIDVYTSKSKCSPRITIHCALEYPRVYYSFDLMGENCGGGCYPGYGSSNFDVHEHFANVALMVEQNLRSHISKDHKIPEKMIREAIDEFQKAITSTEAEKQYTTPCDGCGRNIPIHEIMDYEDKKLCVDCWEKEAFVDKDDENDEGKENQDKFKERRDENGWYICPCCGEKVANPVDSGFCAECDYKKKHPDAEKKFCDDCIHFRYHNLYDENDHTECCCKKHMSGKNHREWTFLCDDYVKAESVEEIEAKNRDLCTYADSKRMEKCPDCKKEFLFLYDGLCLPCYEKKRKKAEKIAKGFVAEGFKEVPDNESENAMYELNGWIDERNMDATEPRKGTRYFLIDIKHLTWKFLFKKV